MSLRKAINDKCRACTYDPLDVGGASHQIAACTLNDCPLHRVRPITCEKLPLRHLKQWGVKPEQLDDRARALVVDDRPFPVTGQNGHGQSIDEHGGDV